MNGEEKTLGNSKVVKVNWNKAYKKVSKCEVGTIRIGADRVLISPGSMDSLSLVVDRVSLEELLGIFMEMPNSFRVLFLECLEVEES